MTTQTPPKDGDGECESWGPSSNWTDMGIFPYPSNCYSDPTSLMSVLSAQAW
jgi:hypothetical protein